MASPKKKFMRAKQAEQAEQEALEAESNVQPELVPEEVEPKKVLVSNPDLATTKRSRPIKSSRSRKKKE